MSDTNGREPTRSALIHIRVQPALRECIEREAVELAVTPSAVVRRILAKHYEGE